MSQVQICELDLRSLSLHPSRTHPRSLSRRGTPQRKSSRTHAREIHYKPPAAAGSSLVGSPSRTFRQTEGSFSPRLVQEVQQLLPTSSWLSTTEEARPVGSTTHEATKEQRRGARARLCASKATTSISLQAGISSRELQPSRLPSWHLYATGSTS